MARQLTRSPEGQSVANALHSVTLYKQYNRYNFPCVAAELWAAVMNGTDGGDGDGDWRADAAAKWFANYALPDPTKET
jgi:hypothetical protein